MILKEIRHRIVPCAAKCWQSELLNMAKIKPSGRQLKGRNISQPGTTPIYSRQIQVLPTTMPGKIVLSTEKNYILHEIFSAYNWSLDQFWWAPWALHCTKLRELSGLRPEPRWGAQIAPQTPRSYAASSAYGLSRRPLPPAVVTGVTKISGFFMNPEWHLWITLNAVSQNRAVLSRAFILPQSVYSSDSAQPGANITMAQSDCLFYISLITLICRIFSLIVRKRPTSDLDSSQRLLKQ